MKLQSLRVRFMLAYAGLIVLGFAGLALIAGQQLSKAARDDYEYQMANEVVLIARGISRSVREFQTGNITQEELDAIVADYESQTEATLTLHLINLLSDPSYIPPGQSAAATDGVDFSAVQTDGLTEQTDSRGERDWQRPGSDMKWTLPEELRGYSELVSASTNTVTVIHRDDANGDDTIFTAAAVVDGPRLMGFVQISESASHLQRALYKRWSALGVGILIMTGVALAASTWLSASLIRPLGKLRDSVLRLSQGDLAHRITDLRSDEIGEVAQAFNQMADRVKAMIEEQRAFASNTSHELRTPLTTMRLRTEALRYDTSLAEEDRQQYVVEMDEELVHLSGLIEDLILLSRFDAGRAELGKDRIDLARFAHSLHQSFVSLAAEKGITLELDVQLDQPVQLEAGLNHLTILFRNLLDNAIKYTPEGGTVRWQVSTANGEALFAVQDTGTGIAPQHLPHLFERFFRADKARSRSIPGTGLGLALAKSIVDAYNGRILVTSQGVGCGTTVSTYWPIISTALQE